MIKAMKKSATSPRRRRTTKTARLKKPVRRRTKKPTTTSLPLVVAPPAPAAVLPVAAVVAAEPERTLANDQSKMKLWLTVGIVSVLIMIGWLYSLQYTIFQTNDSLTADLADANFDRMVQSVQADWKKLQEQAANFSTITNQPATTDTATITPRATTPSTEELNNLFSDIR